MFAQVLVLAAVGGVMVPSAGQAKAATMLPERWKAWAKSSDETAMKKWGMEVAIIKKGIDVVSFCTQSSPCGR